MGNSMAQCFPQTSMTIQLNKDITYEDFKVFLSYQRSSEIFQHMSTLEFNSYLRRKIFIHHDRERTIKDLEQEIGIYENQIAFLHAKLRNKQDETNELFLLTVPSKANNDVFTNDTLTKNELATTV